MAVKSLANAIGLCPWSRSFGNRIPLIRKPGRSRQVLSACSQIQSTTAMNRTVIPWLLPDPRLYRKTRALIFDRLHLKSPNDLRPSKPPFSSLNNSSGLSSMTGKWLQARTTAQASRARPNWPRRVRYALKPMPEARAYLATDLSGARPGQYL